MKKNITATVATLGALALTLSACGGSDSTGGSSLEGLDAETQALAAEAQEAGPVTMYSMLEENTLRVIAEDFSSKYGIQVEPVRLVTADLTQRFSTEASNGNAQADIVLMTDSPFYDDALEQGWITPADEADLPEQASELPEDFYTHDGAVPIVSMVPSEMVMNTDNISEAPTEWSAYADPQYKGRLMLTEPDSSPGNVAFWSLMRSEYGDEFLQDIAANEPTWAGGAVPLTQAIAAGEADLGFPGVAAIVTNLQDSGAPVELASLTPTTGPEVAIGMTAESSNPAGAKLLAAYLMSEEGNLVMNEDANQISPYDAEAMEGFTRVADVELSDSQEIRSLLGLN